MHIYGFVKWLAVAGLTTQLAACASFDGIPEPVIPADAAADLASGPTSEYRLYSALAYARSTVSDDDKQRFRNAFIAIQMAAIDARYLDFRAKLSRQLKGGNFGFDLGILALTSAGSFAAERTANILSAGAAGLTGSKASLNKEVYFEKTLPALIASMDARRLTSKAEIIAKMRDKQYGDYTIAEAIVDLSAYQNAASLDDAIEQVTTSAAIEKQEAQQHYDNLVATCSPEPGASAYWKQIRLGLKPLDPATGKPTLDQASDIVGSDKSGTFDVQRGLILDALVSKYCTVSSVSALVQNFQAKGLIP